MADEGQAEIVKLNEEIKALKLHVDEVTRERDAKDPQIAEAITRAEAAEKELKDRDAKISSLQQQIAKSESLLAVEREKVKSATDLTAIQRNQLDQRDREVTEAEMKRDEAQRDAREASEKMEALRQELALAKVEIEAEKTRSADWQRRFDSYNQVDRAKLDEDITRLSAQVHNLGMDLEKKAVTVGILEESKRSLTEQLKNEQRMSALKDTRITANLSEFASLAQKVKDADGLRRTAEEDVRAKSIQLKLLEKKMDDATFQLQSKDQTIQSLQTRLELTRQQFRAAEEASLKARREATLTNISLGNKELEAQENKRIAQLEATEKQNARLQIDRLRSMLDDERKKRTDVELAQLPLRARVGELELELTELKLEMKALEAQNQRYEATVTLLTDRNASLEANQVSLISAEKRSLDEKNQSKEALTALQEQKALGYDGQLDKAKRDLAVAEKVKETLEERGKALRAQVDSLKATVQERDVEIQKLNEKIKTFEDVTVPDVEAKLETVEASGQQSEAKAQSFEQQLGFAKKKAEEMQKTVIEQTTRAEKLQTDLNIKTDAFDAEVEKSRGLDLKVNELTTKLNGVNKRLEEAEKTVKDVRSQLIEKSKEIFQKEQDVDNIKEEVALKGDELSSSKSQNDLLAAEIKNLKEEKLSLLSRVKVAEVEAKGRSEQISVLHGKIRELRNAVGTKDSALYEMTKNLETVSQEVVSANQRAETLNKGGDAMLTEVRAKDDQLSSLREQLTTLKANELGLKRQVQVTAATAEKLKADISTRETQLEMLRQNATLADSELKAKSEQLQLLSKRTTLLQQELSTKDETLAVMAQKLEAAEMELKLGGAQLGEKNEQVLRGTREKDRLIEELQEKLASLEKLSQTTGGDQSQLLTRIKELEAEQKTKEEKLGRLFFHNTCLLVKMMLSKDADQSSEVSIQELYDEVRAQKIPMADWPMYIFTSLSHAG